MLIRGVRGYGGGPDDQPERQQQRQCQRRSLFLQIVLCTVLSICRSLRLLFQTFPNVSFIITEIGAECQGRGADFSEKRKKGGQTAVLFPDFSIYWRRTAIQLLIDFETKN